MISSNIFWQKIKDMKREICYLKTAHYKTATNITTATQNVNINFTLMLNTMSGEVYSTQRAVVIATSTSGNMVSACYLNSNPTYIDHRFVEIMRLSPKTGKSRFGVAVTAGNSDDYEKLYNGETVNLEYTIQIVGTSNFNISVSYQDIDGGTS